jgi:hypothetical protein
MNTFDASLFLVFIAIPMIIAVAIPSARRVRNVLSAPFYGFSALWVLMSFGFLGNTELMSAVQRLNSASGGVGGWAMLLGICTVPPFLTIIVANLIRGRRKALPSDAQ